MGVASGGKGGNAKTSLAGKTQPVGRSVSLATVGAADPVLIAVHRRMRSTASRAAYVKRAVPGDVAHPLAFEALRRFGPVLFDFAFDRVQCDVPRSLLVGHEHEHDLVRRLHVVLR